MKIEDIYKKPECMVIELITECFLCQSSDELGNSEDFEVYDPYW